MVLGRIRGLNGKLWTAGGVAVEEQIPSRPSEIFLRFEPLGHVLPHQDLQHPSTPPFHQAATVSLKIEWVFLQVNLNRTRNCLWSSRLLLEFIDELLYFVMAPPIGKV